MQKKNRTATTPCYWNTPQEVPVIDRERPGPGYRHLLLKRDIVSFISILPDWDKLAKGLNAILLAGGNRGDDGWHVPGIIAVCAWERGLWRDCSEEYYEEHADIFERLGVPWERTEEGGFQGRFTESTAKAYQLLHILLHELGHHHDQMTTRDQLRPARGESYAEQYARDHEQIVWDRYVEVFGLD